ncbi:MAG: translation initiation factor eIF-1A [Candidatus Woesearchaeota archaeon]
MAQDDEEFKDMDEDKSKKPVQNDQQNDYVRVRMPRGKQVLGIVEQRLGGSRMRVRCLDGNTRVCRIPGRLKRRLWIREGDTILVEPWEISGDERGDVIFKYRYNQVKVLDKKGLLDGIKNEDEF